MQIIISSTSSKTMQWSGCKGKLYRIPWLVFDIHPHPMGITFLPILAVQTKRLGIQSQDSFCLQDKLEWTEHLFLLNLVQSFYQSIRLRSGHTTNKIQPDIHGIFQFMKYSFVGNKFSFFNLLIQFRQVEFFIFLQTIKTKVETINDKSYFFYSQLCFFRLCLLFVCENNNNI